MTNDTSSSHTASSDDVIRRYGSSYLGVFGSPVLALERGEGSHVWDVDGRRYLDLLQGIAVNGLGHAHPRVAQAIAEQAARLIHTSNFFTTPQQVELAERILALADAPADSAVFLTNSGTEALEAAIKLARCTGRPGFVTLEGAFHGRSTGALTLTAKEAYRAPFEPLMPGVVARVPRNDEAALRAVFAERGAEIGAFVLELVQGEAGVLACSPEYVRLARELTQEHGALLIFDEVQTGVGRSGQWFAFQKLGVMPDAFTLAKGLGGGFPIGALVTLGPTVTKLLSAGQHGTTFGGNPLACASALTVLDVLGEPGVLAGVERMGALLEARLREAPGVADVRRMGLLVGIQLAEGLDAGAVYRAGLAHGVIVNAPRPDTVRLAPSLLLTEDEVEEFLAAWPAMVGAEA